MRKFVNYLYIYILKCKIAQFTFYNKNKVKWVNLSIISYINGQIYLRKNENVKIKKNVIYKDTIIGQFKHGFKHFSVNLFLTFPI
jgi:hypothetical protein